MTIHSLTKNSVSVHLHAVVPDIGVVTSVYMCFQSKQQETLVHCIGSVSFGKGKYPIPKGIAEKSAYESMNVFYPTLFPAQPRLSTCSNSSSVSSTPLPKADLDQPNGFMQLVESFLRTISPEYGIYIAIFFGLVFIINTMILWNLVYAMEKQHQQLILLTKKVLEMQQ
jgi:hypothetical protein